MRGKRAFVVASVLTVMSAQLVSCGPKVTDGQSASTDNPTLVVPPAADDARAREDIARFLVLHNERAARLETFESRCAVELRYHDDSGDHFDACEGDLFLASNNRGALRLTKVGNNLMWVGGDGARAWVFRLDSTPTTATIYDGLTGGVQLNASEVVGTGEFMLLSPACVRVLLGFAPLPIDATIVAIPAAAANAPSHERFGVRWSPAKGLSAAMLFTEAGLPAVIRMETLDGKEIVHATLSEPVRASAANIAQGAWPFVARRIELEAPRSALNVRIYLDEPRAEGKRMKQKFFDLDALIAQLQPDVTEIIHPTGNGEGN